MAMKNNKNSTPPTSPSPPLGNHSTPRTKSAPPQPRKKTNHNDFTKNVYDLISSPSFPMQEEEESILPRYDQSKTVIDAQSSTIPPPVHDEHLASSIHRSRKKNDFNRDVDRKLESPSTSPLELYTSQEEELGLVKEEEEGEGLGLIEEEGEGEGEGLGLIGEEGEGLGLKEEEEGEGEGEGLVEEEEELGLGLEYEEEEEKRVRYFSDLLILAEDDEEEEGLVEEEEETLPKHDRLEEETLPKHDRLEEEEAALDTLGPTFAPPLWHYKEEEARVEGKFDLLSLDKAAEELYKLPRFGGIYEAVTVDVERIGKHLKDLSSMNVRMEQNTPMEMRSKGIQIADSVSLLKIADSSLSKTVQIAGQKAQRAVTLMLHAQLMNSKAKELLAQSQDMLKDAALN